MSNNNDLNNNNQVNNNNNNSTTTNGCSSFGLLFRNIRMNNNYYNKNKDIVETEVVGGSSSNSSSKRSDAGHITTTTVSSSKNTSNLCDNNGSSNNNHNNNNSTTSSLAHRETRMIKILRGTMIILLLSTASLSGAGVYIYKRQQEHDDFVRTYEDSANEIIESFIGAVEKSLNAVDTMSTSITSTALATNQTFPYVTIPDFALKGCNLRIGSGTHIIHYMPIITDENRNKWEEYALENRLHIDNAYEQDKYFREMQDNQFGIINEDEDEEQEEEDGGFNRKIQAEIKKDDFWDGNILDDGTSYHPRIWTKKGDVPDGNGPYLPRWHRSPINSMKQNTLNQDFSKHAGLISGGIDIIQKQHVAIMSAGSPPLTDKMTGLIANLQLSQFRQEIHEYTKDLGTFLTYPVFNKFGNDRQVAGILTTNIYWRVLFSNLLIDNNNNNNKQKGLLCVVRNSFNQTFTYQIDGKHVTFLGMGDPHDTKYDNLEVYADINSHLQNRASIINRSYTSVPLSQDVGKYNIRVYPTNDTENEFMTYEPILYTIFIVSLFAFTSIVFILFTYMVEKRQNLMMIAAIESAQRAAATERELNEFLSHEVRNPLAAAIAACNFVHTAVNETKPMSDIETCKLVREDVAVIDASLHFINDFLRSMIDIHRAECKQIKINYAPTNILHDIFEPVSTIFRSHDTIFNITIICPEYLIVMTDCLRLKQVILNLVRNATKFVNDGYICLRADIINGHVHLFVEDSGPGIPIEKRNLLFSKYQESLDILGQGTGIGLALSKNLIEAMDGCIWLDEDYDSGIDGNPGARFVINVNAPPLETEHSNDVVVNDVDVEVGCCDEPTCSLSDSDKFLNVKAVSTTTTSTTEDTKIDENDSNILSELPDNLSVLFVDDDTVLRKLFTRAVKKVQPTWTIREAASGEVAMEICETNNFDLIFLDQYMASVDKQMLGTEVCQVMRRKGIQSIICGLSANDMEDNFKKAGADFFMHKPMPCKKDELHQELALLLAVKAPANDET